MSLAKFFPWACPCCASWIFVKLLAEFFVRRTNLYRFSRRFMSIDTNFLRDHANHPFYMSSITCSFERILASRSVAMKSNSQFQKHWINRYCLIGPLLYHEAAHKLSCHTLPKQIACQPSFTLFSTQEGEDNFVLHGLWEAHQNL